MPDSDDARDSRRKARTTVYQEICKSHASIADFRARLLALLPAVSGASVFIALQKAGGDDGFLGPLGLFGFTAIFGLFMYELRGIEDCVTLRKRAEEIESKLGLSRRESHFRREQGRLRGLADEVGAGWIVYTAVLISWLYVAGRGFGLDDRLAWHGRWPLMILLAFLYVAVLTWALSPPWKGAARLAGTERFRPGDPVLVFGEPEEGKVASVSESGRCAKVKLRESQTVDVLVERLRLR